MDHLTDATFRRTSEWCEFDTDTYLDRRHPNWVLAEEFGDVEFASDVVLVHRAEHIVRALGGGYATAQGEVFELRPPAPCVQARAANAASVVIARPPSRWRTACGWLGIVAGAVVFVAALALSLDDPALVMAFVLVMRGGRLMAC